METPQFEETPIVTAEAVAPETQAADQPIEYLPASEQALLESPEVETMPGWMKAGYEEVIDLRKSNLIQNNTEFVFSDCHINDKVNMNELLNKGYKPDPGNPMCSESNGIMMFKLERYKHELAYKAEVRARNAQDKRLLDQQGSMNGVKPNSTLEEMSLDEAASRMRATDEEFNKENDILADRFVKSF